MLIFISTGPLGHEEPSEVKEPSAETALSVFEEAEIAAVVSKYKTTILILQGQLNKKTSRELGLLVPAAGLVTSFYAVTALT